MRAHLIGAAFFAIALAPATSSAQSAPGPYPPIPYTPGGMAPYPYYPPPNLTPPPTYVPPPGYSPYGLNPRLKYEEGMPPPRGYHLEENPRKGLVISGALVLGGSYLFSALVGGTSSNTDDRWLLLPVFGPFFDIAARNAHGCSSSDTGCNVFDPIIKFYLAVDGIAQVAGGVLLATGFIFPKKEYVSDTYYGRSARGPRIATWTVVPQVTPGARYGLMLRGEVF
jgi:hypothetical protein